MAKPAGAQAAALAAVCFLAGCSSAYGTHSIPTNSAKTQALFKAGAHAVLYVAETDTNAVYTFDPNDITAGPTGSITQGVDYPVALSVGPDNVLYVANFYKKDIALYKPGASAPFKTITSKYGDAGRIAIGADSTIAISYGGGVQHSGELVIYDKGSPTPTRSIFIPLLNNAFLSMPGLEIDATDNIYLAVTRYPNGPAAMLKFAPGSKKGVQTGLAPEESGGFDSAGNMYVGSVNTICMYAPGAKQCTRTVTNGLVSLGPFAVAPSGALFVPNLNHYVEGLPVNGNLVQYAAGGSAPIATYAAPSFINPTATALGSVP